MSKLFNCVNCQKVLKDAPYLVIEDGQYRGLVVCTWRCMAEYAAYEADREEAGDEQPS